MQSGALANNYKQPRGPGQGRTGNLESEDLEIKITLLAQKFASKYPIRTSDMDLINADKHEKELNVKSGKGPSTRSALEWVPKRLSSRQHHLPVHLNVSDVSCTATLSQLYTNSKKELLVVPPHPPVSMPFSTVNI